MVDRLLELFLQGWPIWLIVYAVGWLTTFTFRHRRWILPVWGLFVTPCAVLAAWLGSSLAQMAGQTGGPDGGFVGMRMGMGLHFLGPFVAVLLAFAVAWPRRGAWGWRPILATVALCGVAWGGALAASLGQPGSAAVEIRLLDLTERPLPGVEFDLRGEWGSFAFREGARLTTDSDGIVRVSVHPEKGVTGTFAPRTERWQRVSVTTLSLAAGTFRVTRNWSSGVGVLNQSFAGDTWRPGDPPIVVRMPDETVMAIPGYCAAIPLEAERRSPAEVEQIAAAAMNLEGFRFLAVYGRWLPSQDPHERLAGFRALDGLAKQLHDLRYAMRDITLAVTSAPERLLERQKRVLAGLGAWAGAGAHAEPISQLRAAEDRVAQLEQEIKSWRAR